MASQERTNQHRTQRFCHAVLHGRGKSTSSTPALFWWLKLVSHKNLLSLVQVSHPFSFLCSPSGLDHGVLIVGFGVHTTRWASVVVFEYRGTQIWIFRSGLLTGGNPIGS